MKVNGTHYRSIWYDTATDEVKIIDQRWLPHRFEIVALENLTAFATAIRDMWVRGAPLIGATAAYGMACAMADDSTDAALDHAWEVLHQTRPTAINLRWALNRCRTALKPLAKPDRAAAALNLAHTIAEEDVETNRKIGAYGVDLIKGILAKKPKGSPVNLLTHCNAGWPATVDWGTATSPIYQAHDLGLPIHIWVDETRPRNQGAMTAWELGSHGIQHTYISDNAGGHLLQHGMVDMVIVGTDRTTANGDVCNKIGTYLKALAARDNNVPFYVALPSSTIDWTVHDGIAEIPIEKRPAREVSHIWGQDSAGALQEVMVSPSGTPTENPAFDVTPAQLVSGLITERGIAEASATSLAKLFPEMVSSKPS